MHRGDFTVRPLMEAIHEIGLWTIRLIFIALAVTPRGQILQGRASPWSAHDRRRRLRLRLHAYLPLHR